MKTNLLDTAGASGTRGLAGRGQGGATLARPRGASWGSHCDLSRVSKISSAKLNCVHSAGDSPLFVDSFLPFKKPFNQEGCSLTHAVVWFYIIIEKWFRVDEKMS